MDKWIIRLFLSTIGMIVIAAGVHASNISRDMIDVMEEAVYTTNVVEYATDVDDISYTIDEDEDIYKPIEAEDVDETEVVFSVRESISILILGIDIDGFETDEQGLPDSIIVITVNPEEETTKMVSVPRDTRTEIVGMDFDDKINHAYSFGGTEMMIETVQQILDIPIDYYAKVNMTGFQALVDVVGGVEINNDLDFTFDGIQFPLGTIHLNGAEALGFTRMRQDDPRGDFGRQQRQRLVIEALLNELTSLSDITQLGGILDTAREHLDTNITLDDGIAMLFGGYREALENIEHLQLLIGEGQIIDGIYYQVLAYEEIENARMTLRTHLGLVEEVFY